MTKEEIVATPLPNGLDNGFNYMNSVMVFKGSLAVVNCLNCSYAYDYDLDVNGIDMVFDVWVLGEYGAKESWRKVLGIGPFNGITLVLGFWHYPLMTLFRGQYQIFALWDIIWKCLALERV